MKKIVFCIGLILVIALTQSKVTYSGGFTYFGESIGFDESKINDALDMYKTSNADTMRLNVFWTDIFPAEGVVDEAMSSFYKTLCKRARRKQIEVILILTMEKIVGGLPAAHWAHNYLFMGQAAPFLTAYADFVEHCVKTFNPQGKTVQILNEANEPTINFITFWNVYVVPQGMPSLPTTNVDIIMAGVNRLKEISDDDEMAYDVIVNYNAGTGGPDLATTQLWAYEGFVKLVCLADTQGLIKSIGIDWYAATYSFATYGDMTPLIDMHAKVQEPTNPCYGKTLWAAEVGRPSFPLTLYVPAGGILPDGSTAPIDIDLVYFSDEQQLLYFQEWFTGFKTVCGSPEDKICEGALIYTFFDLADYDPEAEPLRVPLDLTQFPPFDLSVVGLYFIPTFGVVYVDQSATKPAFDYIATQFANFE